MSDCSFTAGWRPDDTWKFAVGDYVYKLKGSQWRGRVCGVYVTDLTERGYAVESIHEPGSVQIYPEAALAFLSSEEIKKLWRALEKTNKQKPAKRQPPKRKKS